MAGNQKKRLALDTNFLLDLAEDSEFAHDFWDVFQAANYSLLTGPTVFRELGFAVAYGSEREKSWHPHATHPVHPKALLKAMR